MLRGRGQKTIGIEVKMKRAITDDDCSHLHWLDRQLGAKLTARIVLYAGRYAYRRSDGIAIVPLSLFGV